MSIGDIVANPLVQMLIQTGLGASMRTGNLITNFLNLGQQARTSAARQQAGTAAAQQLAGPGGMTEQIAQYYSSLLGVPITAPSIPGLEEPAAPGTFGGRGPFLPNRPFWNVLTAAEKAGILKGPLGKLVRKGGEKIVRGRRVAEATAGRATPLTPEQQEAEAGWYAEAGISPGALTAEERRAVSAAIRQGQAPTLEEIKAGVAGAETAPAEAPTSIPMQWQQLEKDLLAQTEEWGKTEQLLIDRDYDAILGQAKTNLTARGMDQTTIMDSLEMHVAEDRGLAHTRVRENLEGVRRGITMATRSASIEGQQSAIKEAIASLVALGQNAVAMELAGKVDAAMQQAGITYNYNPTMEMMLSESFSQFAQNKAIEEAMKEGQGGDYTGLGMGGGSLLGAGLGALLAAPTGGMSMLAGAGVGAAFGGAGGGTMGGLLSSGGGGSAYAGQAASNLPLLLYMMGRGGGVTTGDDSIFDNYTAANYPTIYGW